MYSNVRCTVCGKQRIPKFNMRLVSCRKCPSCASGGRRKLVRPGVATRAAPKISLRSSKDSSDDSSESHETNRTSELPPTSIEGIFGVEHKARVWNIMEQRPAVRKIQRWTPTTSSIGPSLKRWHEGETDTVKSRIILNKPLSVHMIDGCASKTWCLDLARAASELREEDKKAKDEKVDHDRYQGVNLKDIGGGLFWKGAIDIVEMLEQSWAWNQPGCKNVDVVLHHAFVVSYGPSEHHMIHSDGTDLTINISLSQPGTDYDDGGLFFPVKEKISEESKSGKPNRKSTFEGTTWNRYVVENDVGNAVLMDGRLLHGATPIGRGSRHSLILWCRTISRFHRWKSLRPSIHSRVFSFLSIQGISRADTASAGVRDDVWKTLFYRLIGMKGKGISTSSRRDFASHRDDELAMFQSAPGSLFKPTLARAISDDGHFGESFRDGTLPETMRSWRQFFFHVLSDHCDKLDAYNEEQDARMSMCVKMIMPPPGDMLMPSPDDMLMPSPDDLFVNEQETRQEIRSKNVRRAAARCQKVICLEGDIPLCCLFRGTRSNIHAPVETTLKRDSSVIEVRSPFAFASTHDLRIVGHRRVPRHKFGRRFKVPFSFPLFWLTTGPRRGDRSDLERKEWQDLMPAGKNESGDADFEMNLHLVDSSNFDRDGNSLRKERKVNDDPATDWFDRNTFPTRPRSTLSSISQSEGGSRRGARKMLPTKKKIKPRPRTAPRTRKTTKRTVKSEPRKIKPTLPFS